MPGLPAPVRRVIDAGFASTSDALPGEAWERWFRRFTILSAILGAVAIVGATLDLDASWWRRLAGAALMLFLAWWFWSRMLRRPLIAVTDRQVALYIGVALPLFVVLINLHPAYRLLIFAAYWQIFAFLRLAPALLAAALLSIMLQFTFGGWRDNIPLDRARDWGILGLSLLFGGTMAAFIESIMGEGDKRRLLIEQLRATRADLARSERAAGVAAERQRLAGEIHDTLAQDLASIVMHLEAAESRLDDDSTGAGVRVHLSAARQTARDGVNEARRMVHALRPEILAGRTLDEALGHVAAQWSARTGVVTSFSTNGPAVRLDRTSEAVLLRGVQEALANVQKHAAATRVAITLSNLDDEIILDIRDDGRGFEPNLSGAAGDGVGLVTMRERIAEAGGSLAVESAPGEGTVLALTLPIVGEVHDDAW